MYPTHNNSSVRGVRRACTAAVHAVGSGCQLRRVIAVSVHYYYYCPEPVCIHESLEYPIAGVALNSQQQWRHSPGGSSRAQSAPTCTIQGGMNGNIYFLYIDVTIDLYIYIYISIYDERVAMDAPRQTLIPPLVLLFMFHQCRLLCHAGHDRCH